MPAVTIVSSKDMPTFFFLNSNLSEQNVGYKHNAKADKQSICGASLASVGVGFGYHFITYNVKHCAACKGKRKGQYCGSNINGKVADKGTYDLHKSCY